MTPAVLAERKELLAKSVEATSQRLGELLVGFSPNSPESMAIKDGQVRLAELLHRLNQAAAGLQPYTDPDFYRELPPSLALDDQGQHARNKLEQAFPE